MSKTINVEFTGGFHAHQSTTLRARVEDKGKYLGAYISAGQAKKLERTFCGISGCICGGAGRADMEAPEGWNATTEGVQAGGLVAYRDKS